MLTRWRSQKDYAQEAKDRAKGFRTGVGEIDQRLEGVAVSEIQGNWDHQSVDVSSLKGIELKLAGSLEPFEREIGRLLGNRTRPLSNLSGWQDFLKTLSGETSVDRRTVEEYFVVTMSDRAGPGYGDERISSEQYEIWKALDEAFDWSGNRYAVLKYCRGDELRTRHFLWPLERLAIEVPKDGWRSGASLPSLAYTIKSPVEINREQFKAKNNVLKSFGLSNLETLRMPLAIVLAASVGLLLIWVGFWAG
jgi:hypothetical protein